MRENEEKKKSHACETFRLFPRLYMSVHYFAVKLTRAQNLNS